MWAAGRRSIRSRGMDQDLLLATVLLWGSFLIPPVCDCECEHWGPDGLLLPPPLFSLRLFLTLYLSPSLLHGFPTSFVSVCVLACGRVAGFSASSQTDWCMLTFSLADGREMWELSSSSCPHLSLPLKDAVSYNWPCSTRAHTCTRMLIFLAVMHRCTYCIYAPDSPLLSCWQAGVKPTQTPSVMLSNHDVTARKQGWLELKSCFGSGADELEISPAC